MPRGLLDSRSLYDQTKRELSKWLKAYFASVECLNRKELSSYPPERDFTAGWEISVDHNNVVMVFHILLNSRFPYSKIFIAYKSESVYLKWPHFEDNGVLCLPKAPLPNDDIEASILQTLHDAVDLIERCQTNPQFIEDEFSNEFFSYWNRGDNRVREVRSLLNISDRTARSIVVWRDKFTIFGETEEQLRSWLVNTGVKESKMSGMTSAIYAFLDKPIIPPFPTNSSVMLKLLIERCECLTELLNRTPIDKGVSLVLGASSPSGDGLVAVHFTENSMDGFRKKMVSAGAVKMNWMKCRTKLARSRVKRNDSSWIHGRGLDSMHDMLYNADVLVLGCGSVGSQVAARLAQSGVGKLTLVDPETLEAANVGRHELGASSVDSSKATELVDHLRERYPHALSFEGHKMSWQEFYYENPQAFEQCDLIVACIGELSEEGLLGEWHSRSGSTTPIVYGWLDEQATAAHAIALTSGGVSLSCLLENDTLRTPETIWEEGAMKMQAEPACGDVYQPYGAIDVSRAESLTTRLCIDVLTDKTRKPVHRVYAGTTEELSRAGGKWSEAHMLHRPAGFDGAFEYERPLAPCGVCHSCKGNE